MVQKTTLQNSSKVITLNLCRGPRGVNKLGLVLSITRNCFKLASLVETTIHDLKRDRTWISRTELFADGSDDAHGHRLAGLWADGDRLIARENDQKSFPRTQQKC